MYICLFAKKNELGRTELTNIHRRWYQTLTLPTLNEILDDIDLYFPDHLLLIKKNLSKKFLQKDARG